MEWGCKHLLAAVGGLLAIFAFMLLCVENSPNTSEMKRFRFDCENKQNGAYVMSQSGKRGVCVEKVHKQISE